MKRAILAVLAGLVVWMLVATLINFGLRAGLARCRRCSGPYSSGQDGPTLGARRHYSGVVYSGAHSTLGEVPGLVSPGVFGNSVAACGDGRSACKRALAG